MKNLKRLVAGIAFSAVLATMLLATGADAYAKTKAGGGNGQNNGGGSSQPSAPQPGGTFEAMGISWE